MFSLVSPIRGLIKVPIDMHQQTSQKSYKCRGGGVTCDEVAYSSGDVSKLPQ